MRVLPSVPFQGASFQPQQAGKEPQEHYVLLDHNGEGTTHEPGLTPQHIRELLRTKTCHCPRKRRKTSSGSFLTDTAPEARGLAVREQSHQSCVGQTQTSVAARKMGPSQGRKVKYLVSKARMGIQVT